MEGNTEKEASGSQIGSEDLVDRISNLSDTILSHILSFLPTKNSVATAILSQRWKFLWKTVSNFDFCNFYTLDKLEDIDDVSKIDWDLRYRQIDVNLVKFIPFVNKVLLHRTAGSINKFSLAYEAQSISFDVNDWISTAIDSNVQNLFLNIYVRDRAVVIEPPPRIFSCESLHSLELKYHFFIHSANVVILPRLETLKLHKIRFQDEETFQKLILGCPVLKCLCISTFVDYKDMVKDTDEDMEDYRHIDKNVFKFIVYSTSLRRLELEVFGDLPDTSYCSLELEAPSLQTLKLQDCISRIFLQGSLSSLDEVQFEINPFVIGGDELSECSCDYVVEAVRAFSCAKGLTISNNVMRALSYSKISLSTKFNRLTKFGMMADYSFWVSLQDSMDFIQCSDSLEFLVFDKRFYSELKGKGIGWEIPNKVPKCLTNSLNGILFYAFEGYKDEMEMVEYLLKHGSVLLIVHIHVRVEPCYQDYKKKFEMLQQISNFSRKSPVCQLHFL